MKIKTFNFPTFEEWKNSAFKNISINLGDYYCKIASVCFSNKNTNYFCFVVSLNANTTYKLFNKSFLYTGDYKSLKTWYENTISEFNEFWKEYITETYFEN